MLSCSPSVGTITACCDGGTIYDEEANIGQGCCQPPSVVDEDGNCVSPQVRYKRRAYPGDMPLEDPLRVASWREGSDRLNLSPRMVADMLLNNFEIEWQGQRFRAFEMQHNNAKRWEILLRRGISTVAKYTTGHLLSRHIREVTSSSFLPRVTSRVSVSALLLQLTFANLFTPFLRTRASASRDWSDSFESGPRIRNES